MRKDPMRPAPAAVNRCRSWRIKGGRIVRCSWKAEHAGYSKWHCAESSTGHIWYVRDRERARWK